MRQAAPDKDLCSGMRDTHVSLSAERGCPGALSPAAQGVTGRDLAALCSRGCTRLFCRTQRGPELLSPGCAGSLRGLLPASRAVLSAWHCRDRCALSYRGHGGQVPRAPDPRLPAGLPGPGQRAARQQPLQPGGAVPEARLPAGLRRPGGTEPPRQPPSPPLLPLPGAGGRGDGDAPAGHEVPGCATQGPGPGSSGGRRWGRALGMAPKPPKPLGEPPAVP